MNRSTTLRITLSNITAYFQWVGYCLLFYMLFSAAHDIFKENGKIKSSSHPIPQRLLFRP